MGASVQWRKPISSCTNARSRTVAEPSDHFGFPPHPELFNSREVPSVRKSTPRLA